MYETHSVNELMCIASCTNLTNPDTKPNNLLFEVLKITLITRTLTIDFTDAERKSYHQSIGQIY